MDINATTDLGDRLRTLAYDLWWCWQPDGPRFWADLGGPAWVETGNNPVRLLQILGRAGVAERAPALSTRLEALEARREAYLAQDDTWHEAAGAPCRRPVAYFSAEYGIHESLPTYSGGLGILAGDHVKSASDLGLPYLAIGLLYRTGYVRQQIDAAGEQVNLYPTLDFDQLPIRPCPDPDRGGEILRVEIPMGSGAAARVVCCQVWQVRVGRVRLYLLDADVGENAPPDRAITHALYGGGPETRIRQELLLGVGGVRLLRRLGIEAGVHHLNEGHASFLALERIRELVAQGMPFQAALEACRDTNVFTTHTPVEAGHDRFAPDLLWAHLAPLAEALGLDREALLRLGRWPGQPNQGPFNMTLLALHTCARYNGVARLHGEVSRQMFAPFWPGVPAEEAPITHVTNGVHAPTWQAPELAAVVEQTLGAGWRDRPWTDPSWARFNEIPPGRFWAVRRQLKARLLALVRRREQARRARLSLPPLRDRLDPDALTIGFARRFAPYKRANLIFRDVRRLREILEQAPGPLQLIFAGKAHPADAPGRALVRAIHEASHLDGFAGRVFLIEDYDIEVGRAMVQGVDVWLNNPRRPKEASGTSGMKAAMNGAPNLSILDGWWPEGFDGTNGWAIGDEQDYPDADTHDAADAASLYRLLEASVIPLYFDRDASGVPTGWVQMLKAAIATCTPRFHSDRQVRDYVTHLYAPGTPPFA